YEPRGPRGDLPLHLRGVPAPTAHGLGERAYVEIEMHRSAVSLPRARSREQETKRDRVDSHRRGPYWGESRMVRRVARKALELAILNCVLFLGYRLVFLREFAGAVTAADRNAALLHGLRLDVALLGMQASLVAAAALLRRRVRDGFVLALLW